MNSNYNNVKAQQLAGATETKAEKKSWGDRARRGAIILGTAGGCGAAAYGVYKVGEVVVTKVRS